MKMDPIKFLEPTETDLSTVTLIDVMGSDGDICDAASISYSATAKNRQSTDRDLLRYLMRHWHTSPFEMAELKFYLKLPIYTARQLIRHRTANLNELSGRYSVMPDEFQVPDQFHFQSVANKQGSGGPLDPVDNAELRNMVSDHNALGFQMYNDMVDNKDGYGVSKEEARMHLPLSTYTEMVWKIDAHNLMHFLRLRTDSHAQADIRKLAVAMAAAFEHCLPLCFEAWVDYQRDAVSLSRMESNFLKNLILAHDPDILGDRLTEWAVQYRIGARELDEFKMKLGLV